jgi:hypothetical protein
MSAVIVDAQIAAGHDGAAEMVVLLRHDNGVIAPVVLDADTGFGLMRAAGAADLGALIGRSWRDIIAEPHVGDLQDV